MNEALVVLVLAWAVLLIPSAIRARKTSPHATVGGFERAMDVLRSEAGGVSLPPDTAPGINGEHASSSTGQVSYQPSYRAGASMNEDPVVARRRVWFVRALAGSGVTFLAALIIGGWLWLAFLLATVLSAGYATVLRRLKLQRDEARQVVRDLDLRRAVPQVSGEVLLQAGAGGGGAVGPVVAEQPGAWESNSVRLRRWDD